MASNREQLQAHQFLVQRAVSALVTRETDPEQPPFRRPGAAAFAGLGLAVIALVVAGVFGLIFPGGNLAWQDGKSVIVEKETGTRYVYLHGKLHPVANYSSALLALGEHAETRSVSGNSLAGAPRGPRIGIPDAPDALADPDRLLDGGWTLCSKPGTDLTGATVHRSALLVGGQPTGGAAGAGALLVQVPGADEQFLIAGGYRHRISRADAVVVGLALGAGPALEVGPAIVDLIPAGEPIGPIPVPDAGQPSTAVPSRPDLRVGQLLVMTTSGGAVQRFLAEPDRLRPITGLAFDIQLAHQPTTAAYPGGEPVGIPLSPLAVAEAQQRPAAPAEAGAPPSTRPSFATSAAGIVCLTFDPGSFAPRLTVDPVLPPGNSAIATPRRTGGGVALADEVLVPPGGGAVIEVMPSAQAPAGALAVVTDLGKAYPLADPDLLGALGYAGTRPVRLPAGLVARIPHGPGLDREAAMQQW
ncbi:type VII secretion protein EccB [Saccharopolyspora indica]|uniref:type VII secretion protein EccB n=1 Tax=Saccharopolyspora indica TaxID=1229659 RepID=UPI0022EAACF5|nr:type VII secretion protein EccB [Saccharopolyspora indica]MDA3647184.1 type VII secretion protein EccB [Saccharopolyspora indica]